MEATINLVTTLRTVRELRVVALPVFEQRGCRIALVGWKCAINDSAKAREANCLPTLQLDRRLMALPAKTRIPGPERRRNRSELTSDFRPHA